MERLGEDFKMLSTLTTAKERALIISELKKCLDKIHSAGFVHGDFREYNILCNINTKQIKVVDFEFSGPEGALYPVKPNPLISWPSGVAFRQPLCKAHDEEFFQRHMLLTSSERKTSDSDSTLLPYKKHRATETESLIKDAKEISKQIQLKIN